MSSDSNEVVLWERRGSVDVCTINRPKALNAINSDVLNSLLEGFSARVNDPALRAVVLTGAGNKAFVAGADIAAMQHLSAMEAESFAALGHRVGDAIRQFPRPVIAAVQGFALGGGCELAMACDIRIAAAHADLGLIQSKLNLTTAWGGGIDLINAIGNSAALEVLCSGRRLTATEALDMRIYSTVAGDDSNFASFVADYLTSFTQPGLTVFRSYKATAARRRHALQAELLETARDGFIESWNHEDHWDAARRALPIKS